MLFVTVKSYAYFPSGCFWAGGIGGGNKNEVHVVGSEGTKGRLAFTVQSVVKCWRKSNEQSINHNRHINGIDVKINHVEA